MTRLFRARALGASPVDAEEHLPARLLAQQRAAFAADEPLAGQVAPGDLPAGVSSSGTSRLDGRRPSGPQPG
ncbi:MAG: hypothetical protein U0935_20440 [Pirellulales bacterium]